MKLIKKGSRLFKAPDGFTMKEFFLYPTSIEQLLKMRSMICFEDSFNRNNKEECRGFKVPFMFNRKMR